MKTVAAPRGINKTKKEGENPSQREKNGSPKDNDKKKEPLQNHIVQIERMKKENQSLKKELETEIRLQNRNEPMQEHLMEEMQEIGAKFANRIELETKRMKDLQRKIDETKVILKEKKKQINSEDSTGVLQMQKKVKTLEHRLEKVKQRHNELQAENKRLIEKLNASRRDRVIYDNVFKKLEIDLKVREDELKHRIFESIQIETERKAAEDELFKIQRYNEKEVASFRLDYHKAFSVIVQENQEEENEEQEVNETNIDKNASTMSKPPSIARKLGRMPSFKKQGNEKKMESFELSLFDNEFGREDFTLLIKKIKSLTNAKSNKELLALIKNIDEDNRKSFEMARQIEANIEELETKIETMEQNVQNFYIRKEEHEKDTVTRETDGLKEMLFDEENRLLSCEKVELERKTYLNTMMGGIKSLYTSLKCNLISDDDNLKLHEDIKYHSITGFLSVIEKRVSDIIELYKYLKETKSESKRDRETELKFIEGDVKGTVVEEEKMEIFDIIDTMEKLKEDEKIMTKKEFQDMSTKEFDRYKRKQLAKKRTLKPN